MSEVERATEQEYIQQLSGAVVGKFGLSFTPTIKRLYPSDSGFIIYVSRNMSDMELRLYYMYAGYDKGSSFGIVLPDDPFHKMELLSRTSEIKRWMNQEYMFKMGTWKDVCDNQVAILPDMRYVLKYNNNLYTVHNCHLVKSPAAEVPDDTICLHSELSTAKRQPLGDCFWYGVDKLHYVVVRPNVKLLRELPDVNTLFIGNLGLPTGVVRSTHTSNRPLLQWYIRESSDGRCRIGSSYYPKFRRENNVPTMNGRHSISAGADGFIRYMNCTGNPFVKIAVQCYDSANGCVMSPGILKLYKVKDHKKYRYIRTTPVTIRKYFMKGGDGWYIPRAHVVRLNKTKLMYSPELAYKNPLNTIVEMYHIHVHDDDRNTWVPDQKTLAMIKTTDIIKTSTGGATIKYLGEHNIPMYYYRGDGVRCPICGMLIPQKTKRDIPLLYVDDDGRTHSTHVRSCCIEHKSLRKGKLNTDKGFTMVRVTQEYAQKHKCGMKTFTVSDERNLILVKRRESEDFYFKPSLVHRGKVPAELGRYRPEHNDVISLKCTHVHQYGYKPTPTFFGETDNHKYIGVELELMYGGTTDENAEKICNGFSELYAKRDGSLTRGLELVTEPCSVGYHIKDFGWETVVDRAKRLGYEDASGSGIHVHVSRDFWKDKNKIADLIMFADLYRQNIFCFSGRTEGKFNEWASMYFNIENARQRMGKSNEELMYEYEQRRNHTRGINIKPRNTVEFRFFASTTNADRVKSIVEFVDCLSDMSLLPRKEMSWEKIKDIAIEKRYTHLLSDELFIESCNVSA